LGGSFGSDSAPCGMKELVHTIGVGVGFEPMNSFRTAVIGAVAITGRLEMAAAVAFMPRIMNTSYRLPTIR